MHEDIDNIEIFEGLPRWKSDLREKTLSIYISVKFGKNKCPRHVGCICLRLLDSNSDPSKLVSGQPIFPVERILCAGTVRRRNRGMMGNRGADGKQFGVLNEMATA